MNFSAIPKPYITILSFTFIAFIFLNGRAIAKDTIIATNSGPSIHQAISKPLTFTDIKTKAYIQLAEANTKSYLPKQKAKYKKKKKKIHRSKKSTVKKYRSRVRRHLAKHRLHPGAWLQGRVTLNFTISRNGEVSKLRLERRSHSKKLNRAALAMVVYASPFPRIPRGGPSRIHFSVPINFR